MKNEVLALDIWKCLTFKLSKVKWYKEENGQEVLSMEQERFSYSTIQWIEQYLEYTNTKMAR